MRARVSRGVLPADGPGFAGQVGRARLECIHSGMSLNGSAFRMARFPSESPRGRGDRARTIPPSFLPRARCVVLLALLGAASPQALAQESVPKQEPKAPSKKKSPPRPTTSQLLKMIEEQKALIEQQSGLI